jgi:hypothetical protein
MEDSYFKARYASETHSLQMEAQLVEQLSAAVAKQQLESLGAAHAAAAAATGLSRKAEVGALDLQMPT